MVDGNYAEIERIEFKQKPRITYELVLGGSNMFFVNDYMVGSFENIWEHERNGGE